VNVNNNNYTCCAKMVGKEETPKCRKKTVTRTNEMIEDLIDFIEIHPIVAFEAIYEVSIQENLNSSLCIHDARNFDEYTQVLAGDTTNKMAFLGGEEGAALCIALLCTIVLRRWRLANQKTESLSASICECK
jgi:hypothetical protein